MAQLLLFSPCERAIVEQSTNTFSLIGVLQELAVSPNDDGTMPPLAAMKWSAVALWMREPQDEGKRLEQRFTVTDPAGKLLMDAVAEFEMTKPFHRVIVQIDRFPVKVSGQYRLNMSLRSKGDETWSDRGFFPLLVVHQTATTSPANASR